MSTNPRVLTDIDLADFVQHILDTDSTTCLLIVCASKDTFIKSLLATCAEPQTNHVDAQGNGDVATNMLELDGGKEPQPHSLLTQPSLLKLASSQSVTLAFCPDIAHLRAYLATLAVPKPHLVDSNGSNDTGTKPPIRSLVGILNPIEVHRSTSSFSAQGFNRTLALAVEAAHAIKSHLLMVECPSLRGFESEQFDADDDYEDEIAPSPPAPENPWDEEVSILNVTTKSFGAGGRGRGWVGRTVSLRTIAKRWFVFSAFQRQEEGEEVQ